ncbi:hypothetical protein K4F52_004781 [Lecanicillium sp. MT-2017a]|nr:hypothetical protein K4F52_004781 [Lecanicillium sp. MT-2017a]
MAIRDRVRRALRKSEASNTMTQTESNTTAATNNTSQSSSTLDKTTSRLARVLTFGGNSSSSDSAKEEKKQKKKEKKSRGGRVHPRDKPLTAQNLRHQEMLSHFSMTFGASDPSQIETQSFMGVSPCCTRPGSPRASISLDMTGSTTSFSTSTGTDSSRE